MTKGSRKAPGRNSKISTRSFPKRRTAEVEAAIEAARANGIVSIKLSDGRELEVDLKGSGVPLEVDDELMDFLTGLLSQVCGDD